jgi:hypothetical protein
VQTQTFAKHRQTCHQSCPNMLTQHVRHLDTGRSTGPCKKECLRKPVSPRFRISVRVLDSGCACGVSSRTVLDTKGGPLLLTVFYGVLVIGGICLVALGGLELVQRLVPADSRQQHNDVAGFIYAALGVIYAVLLALVVIAVWEEYGAANDTVEQEANAVAEIFWLAHQLPEPEGRELQELCRSYVEEVINVGWPLMQEGRTPSLKRSQESSRGWVLIDDIRASVQEIEPHTKADEQLYAEGLDQVQRLADARRMRLVASEEGIPGVLWAVLIFGGIAAVSFTYLFGLENTWAHRLMVITLAAVIGLVLFTIGAIEHPFSGGARIGTGAFELVLERFETSDLSDLKHS